MRRLMSGPPNRVCCSECGNVKFVLAFRSRTYPSGSIGVYQPCRDCKRNRNRVSMRRWRRTPKGVKSTRASLKKWHALHPEYERERSVLRYKTDPTYAARIRHAKKAWMRRNPFYQREYDHRRRLRRNYGRTIASSVRSRDIQKLFDAYDRRCAYCGKRCTLTVDHIIPFASGGVHARTNLAPACRPCNTRKHTRPVSSMFRCVADEREFWVRHRRVLRNLDSM